MTLEFATLFTLSLTHTYYGGACDDFEFVLPPDAAAVLTNGRMVARARDGRLHVLYQAAADDSPVASQSGQTLRIGLRLKNPAFANFTASLPDSGSVAVYGNASAPAALDAPVTMARQGRAFSHPLAVSTRPLTVTIADRAGRVATTATVTSGDDTTVSFDVSTSPSGAFQVNEEAADGSVTSTSYYIDPDLAAAPALAVVEIALDDALYSAAPDFEIAFEAAADTLKYYVVVTDTPGDADVDRFSVAGAGPDVAFTRVPVTDFGGDDLDTAQLVDAGSKVVLFRSTSEVSRRREPETRIQLKGDDNVLVASLPQAADRPGADVIVHVKKMP